MKIISFHVENILSYQEYLNIISDLKNWYLPKKKEITQRYAILLLKKDYSCVFDIIKEHNHIIVELWNQIIQKLKLDEKEIGIYLSNSFARETNLLDSDIDINFIYQHKDLEIYEELSESIFVHVLDTYRDFVHDSVSHRLVKGEVNEEVSYELIFKDQIVMEPITHGNEKMMDHLFHTKKDLNSFFHYYTSYLNSEETAEWMYFQKPLTQKYTNRLFSYIEESIFYISEYRNEEKEKNTINKIKYEYQELEGKSFDFISDIKKYYKNHAFQIIYESLILLNQRKKHFKITTVNDLLNNLQDPILTAFIQEYFGYIMILNYLCDLYSVPFRTRIKTKISPEFKDFISAQFGSNLLEELPQKIKNIYCILLQKLESKKCKTMEYNIHLEHINIPNYSPLSKVNESSFCYQSGVYLLPFIQLKEDIVPIHPDTLDDLKISREKVVKYEPVSPTSSTRTVFSLNEKKYYKLALLRRITRSIRDLKNKELKRSEIASKVFQENPYPKFYILKEICVYGEEEIYNYIIREYPNKLLYPWFYLIVTDTFSKEKMLKIIFKMIDIWLFYASKGIYFESAHTQNFLIDEDLNIYYRDMSDIRMLSEPIMRPSYIDELNSLEELHSIFFDRSMLSQNIEHFLKNYPGVEEQDKKKIKAFIKEKIKEYHVVFPPYSMNYDKTREGHHPIKLALHDLRKDE